MQQVFGKKVKVSLPKSYHSADAKKDKVLVFKGVSNNITIEDFKHLLDFNKVTHAEAERIKSKRTGKDLPFIKIKSDNPKQAEALISGRLICQKTGIIFKVEEFRIMPRSSNVSSATVSGTRHKIVLKNRNVLCVMKLIHTKTVQTETKKKQNVQTVGDPMSPITEAVLGSIQGSSFQATCGPKSNFLCLHCKTSFTTTPQQHI